jgi:hypothetical protein
MFYKNILLIVICMFLSNCTTITFVNNSTNKIVVDGYSNKGFALIYNESLYEKKIVTKKINERDLIIFQKNLKMETSVKITNILNNKSIIAKVGKDADYPQFNNSVLSIRIAQELDLDMKEPYVQVLEILEDSIFIAKKAKTFDEEKKVAIKAPVSNISINDLNIIKQDKTKKFISRFSYTVKIADFYFKDSALMMSNRIKNDSSIENPKIKKISAKKYRVYLGPFSNINSLKKSFNDISIMEFENIEIIRND